MAKKEETLSYGASFLPKGEKKYSVIRWGWNGLNRTDDIDTGQLTDMSGMICDPPYMVPVKRAKLWIDFADGIPTYLNAATDSHNVSEARRISATPIAIYGFDKQLIMVWGSGDSIAYVTAVDKFQYAGNDTTFATYRGGLTTYLDDTPRSVVQFNVADTSSGNIVEYTYDKRFLLYPDCISFPYDFTDDFEDGTSFNTLANPIPAPLLAAVYQSRVFGVTTDATTASAFNSYVDYTLDTADDVSAAHAWWSMAGSNTEANGDFTAIVAYDNHVVLFRKDFMQLVYNNKNPFRVVDVGAFGCDSYKAWTILNGVLYFASQEKVYAFTGGTPKDISSKLELSDLSGVVLGSYKDTLWMQTKTGLYLYKDGTWSDIGFAPFDGYGRVVQFATLDYALVALVDDEPEGSQEEHTYSLMFMDWDVDAMDPKPVDPEEWEPNYTGTWYFETDLMALGKLDIRRVKKFSLLCEGGDGSAVAVYLLPDGEKFDLATSVQVGKLTPKTDGYHLMRILTRQFSGTMHRLRFTGKGYMKIHAAELKISWGGDVYVEG